MRLRALLAASHLFLSDTLRHGPIPAGMRRVTTQTTTQEPARLRSVAAPRTLSGDRPVVDDGDYPSAKI